MSQHNHSGVLYPLKSLDLCTGCMFYGRACIQHGMSANQVSGVSGLLTGCWCMWLSISVVSFLYLGHGELWDRWQQVMLHVHVLSLRSSFIIHNCACSLGRAAEGVRVGVVVGKSSGHLCTCNCRWHLTFHWGNNCQRFHHMNTWSCTVLYLHLAQCMWKRAYTLTLIWTVIVQSPVGCYSFHIILCDYP